jgi:hypothetical protein
MLQLNVASLGRKKTRCAFKIQVIQSKAVFNNVKFPYGCIFFSIYVAPFKVEQSTEIRKPCTDLY